jgi:L-Ala-D/L-Glu epimerase
MRPQESIEVCEAVPLKLHVELEKWPLARPFTITGHTFEFIDVVLVGLTRDGHVGRGEGAGVYYRGDRPAGMIRQIESLRAQIEAGIAFDSVQQMLPPGGARNALDCALWDLTAKLTCMPAWKIAGIQQPQPLLTTFTCGAGDPEQMAAVARKYEGAQAIKLKLTGDPIDADRVLAVREARLDVWLGVDANQGLNPRSLERLLPTLINANVSLLEQPFPREHDEWLDGLSSPIPIAADESVQDHRDVIGLVDRYQLINIKLDKCGGLTEALKMARVAREVGLGVMVGNMLGTSLAMAPAYVLGQTCSVVDLDGPVFLRSDRQPCVTYFGGEIACPESLWGQGAE